MWLYYSLIIFIVLIGILFEKLGRNIYLYIVFGVFLVIAGFRADIIGNDTRVYTNLFKSIAFSDDLSIFSPRFELGYVYFNKLLTFFSTNPQIILFSSSLIILFGFMKFIQSYSKIPWLSVYLFFTLGYFGMTMNTIRLNMALVIILYSYNLLRKNQVIRFVVVVLLASLFHRTAIIFLIAWPIKNIRISKKNIIGIVLMSAIIYSFFPVFINILFRIFPTYQYYLGSEYLNGEIRLASVMNMLVGVSIITFGLITRKYTSSIETSDFVYVKTKQNLNVNDKKLMLLLLILSVPITFLSFRFNLLDRVSDYFLVFAIVYLPNAIKDIRDKKLLLIILVMVIFLFFLYSTFIQILRPDWNRIYPYYFFKNI